MDFSFSKKNRILSRKEFSRLYSLGLKREARFFYVHYLFKDGEPKIGLTVSRKVGNAVKRSFVKRHLREAFRVRKSYGLSGLQMIISAKKSASFAEGLQLQKDLERILNEISS
ncbi:ribonuclease P protein component [PVC group bacterium (ex Bugula neritina AB1)]|nr:ribonuclease P protein component [PVC group bacterium (ex Bugula neritina AB1)]